MKLVDVVPAIKIRVGLNGENTEEIQFKKFLVFHLDNYAEIKSLSQVRQVNKIVAAIEDAAEAIKLEDADYELVKASLQSPKYTTTASRQLLAFYDAFERAQEVKV